jgi:hypothetical protein
METPITVDASRRIVLRGSLLRLRDQLIIALILCVATYFALLRIAEAKNEAVVGGDVIALDVHRRPELEALQRLGSQAATLGDPDLTDRLDRLRERRELLVAPLLGPERWAVFVVSLSLVRRIYVRHQALLDPVAHLYRTPRPDIPRSYQEAHAWIGLAGALRHELAHYDGLRTESRAYESELAWYEARRPFLDRLPDEERRAWQWGLESAIPSARKARETTAGVTAAAPP